MNDETKLCPVSAETIKAAAIKCRFCNTDLTAYLEQKESNVEKMLFLGHPQVITTAWQWIAVVCTLGLAYGYY